MSKIITSNIIKFQEFYTKEQMLAILKVLDTTNKLPTKGQVLCIEHSKGAMVFVALSPEKSTNTLRMYEYLVVKRK